MKISTSTTKVSQRSAGQRLRQMAESFGFRVDVSDSFDIDFSPPTMSLGRVVGDIEFEERLAHELGHFLMAPKYRRRTYNFGHENGSLTQNFREREELAAAVLGMLLQKHFDGHVNSNDPAYLWNWDSRWRGKGFWVGAQTLIEKGWMTDDFDISSEKLKQFCKEEAHGG